MATVTIRNLDDEVVNSLKAKAKENGRSLEAELREILARASQSRKPTLDEFREIAERIAAMTPDVPQTDSTEIIREMRDR